MVLVIVAIVLTIVLSSSSPSALPDAANVAILFDGIPQHGLVLGDPHAPVKLVEWIDLQCDVCKEFESTELPTLIQKYVRPGKLRIEMKPWNIIDANHPGTHDSLRGQKATIAAAAQDKAFQFAQVLYENQGREGTGWLDSAMISRIGVSVAGLNPTQLEVDTDSAATSSLIQRIDSYANSQPNFVATPAFQLAKGNGKPQFYGIGRPAMDLVNLEPAIDALLR